MAELKNYMEEIVRHQVKDVLKDIDMCKCEKCLLDVAALALNDLKPKYIVSKKGELYSKLNILKEQFDVDVTAAITKAAMIVKKSTRHDEMNNK